MKSPSRSRRIFRDSSGRNHPGYIVQDWIDASSHHGEACVPGQREAFLEDGTRLDYVDRDTFKNVITGELLTVLHPG